MNLNFPKKYVDNVKDYYTKLINDGAFDVENFSEDDITKSREINLAEFSRSLGKFIVNRIPSLISSTETNAINEIGFGVLGICLGIDNKHITEANRRSMDIQKSVGMILMQADKISQKLNATFSKLLKQNISFSGGKSAKKNQYSTGLSTTFKILSYYAALWDREENDINKSIQNIPAYYLFDYLNSSWTAHGDQRLYEYYKKISNKDYLKPITKDDFRSSFNQWINESTGVRKTFSKEIKAIITIHSNLTYLATELPTGEDYEFEHIIPKARILSVDKKLISVHLSALGNGMFLPKSLNNSKKEQTLYEAGKETLFENLISDSTYPTKEEFSDIFSALEEENFSYVNEQIDSRSRNLSNQIIDKIISN